MMTRICVLLLLFTTVFCGPTLSFGQGFVACLYDDATVLTDACTGGAPLADGTPIVIFHDFNGNGPDAADMPAALCNDPPLCFSGLPEGSHNLNTFGLNGVAQGLGPGLFYMDPCFGSIGGSMPTVARYYLKITLANGLVWTSAVFTPVSGPQDVNVTSWTCTPGAPPIAPFTSCLYNDVFVLTDGCNGGAPLTDGTPVQIYWDANSNGPDPSDVLAPLCNDPPNCASGLPLGSHNLNTFAMNGVEMGLGAGLFFMDPCFGSVGITPAVPRYYLKIMLPSGLVWTSAVLTVASGPQDVDITSWTCIAPNLAIDPSPANHAQYVSTDAVLSWTAGYSAQSHDVYFGTSNPPPFIRNQMGTTYNPGPLTMGTQYFWRVDELLNGVPTLGSVWQFSTLCVPSAQPVRDEFSSASLEPCWYRMREDTAHYSLTTRPGWLRITTQPGEVYSNAYNAFTYPRYTEDLILETHLNFAPTANYQQAGIMLWLDSTRHVLLHRYYSGGQRLVFRGDHTPNGYDFSTSIINASTDLYLRLATLGAQVTASYSSNGTVWTTLGSYETTWLGADTKVGVFASNGSGTGAPQIPADFDYVSVQPNCPKYVSGTWDLAHSPYLIRCDNIVAPGQTLTIEPGVEVRFVEDVSLQVQGTLIAEGTAQDSIRFWADTLENSARWNGVRFLHAQGANRLSYCSFRNGSSLYSDTYHAGGAVFTDSAQVIIRHCAFLNNRAQNGGALELTRSLPGSYVDSCVFRGNVQVLDVGGGAGGAIDINAGAAPVTRCLFVGNRAGYGGAISVGTTTNSVTRCTFVDNTASTAGALAYCWIGNIQLNSCIFTGNGTSPLFRLDGGSSASANYSDIADIAGGFGNPMPQGFGVKTQVNVNGDSVDTYHNLFLAPGFADTLTYALAVNSHCLNAADPALPLDPDYSYADMGYLWANQFPPCVSAVQGTWTHAQSPVLVSCNLIVPAGQTLTVEPGVEVRFTGDYVLVVDGALIAEGTAQDSVTFWADTLQNPNRWGGVRIRRATGDCRFAYCKFLNGNGNNGTAFGNSAYDMAGALYADSSRVMLRHCRFARNQAVTVGAVNLRKALTGSVIDSCSFIENFTQANGGSGALRLSWNPVPVSHSLFVGNRATWGGAIDASSTGNSFTSCTFVNNQASSGGAIGLAWNGGVQTYNSCIFSQNGNRALFNLENGAMASIVYSDVADMVGGFSNHTPPANFGVLSRVNANGDSTDTYFNLFRNPLFSDLLAYPLDWNSPCIDAGDPALASDPDGTTRDEGYLAYFQPTLVADPDTLEFWQIVFGGSAMASFTLTNTSTADAHLSACTVSNTIFSVQSPTFPAVIPAGGSLDVSVRCTPVTEGDIRDTLRVLARLAGPDYVAVRMHVTVPYVPADPESLVVRPGSTPGNIQLNWPPVTHTTSGRPFTPQFYVVYGSTNPAGPFIPIASPTTNSYTHTGIVNTQIKYYYKVTAYAGSTTDLPPALKRQIEAQNQE